MYKNATINYMFMFVSKLKKNNIKINKTQNDSQSGHFIIPSFIFSTLVPTAAERL